MKKLKKPESNREEPSCWLFILSQAESQNKKIKVPWITEYLKAAKVENPNDCEANQK